MAAADPATSPDTHEILASSEAGGAAIRGGVLRVVGYAIGVLVSVLSAALLFRHLGVDHGGEYVTVLSLVTLAGGVTDAGLAAIGVREFSTRGPVERRAMLRSLLGIRLVFSVLGVAGATIFAIGAGYDSPLVAGTVVAGAGLVLQTFQGTLTISLLAGLRLGSVTALDLARQIAAVVFVVGLVLADAGLLWFWAVGLLAALVSLVVTAWTVRGEVPLVPAFHPTEWRALLKDVVPFAVATAVAAVYFRIAIIIVSLVAPGAETGYFGASFRVIEVLIAVPSLIVGSAFPIFSHAAANDTERLGYALGRTFDASLIGGIGIALGFGLGAPFVISVVAGPEFAPAAGVLRIQGAALAISFVGAVFGYALLSLRAHRAILVVSLVGVAANAALTIALTHVDGARGAAMATATAELLLTVALALAVRRASIAVAVSWTAVPRVLLAAALALLVVLTGLPPVAQAVVAVAVYVAALVALRALPPELVDEARRRLPGRTRVA